MNLRPTTDEDIIQIELLLEVRQVYTALFATDPHAPNRGAWAQLDEGVLLTTGVTAETGVFIGALRQEALDISYFISPDFWGQGYGSELVNAWLENHSTNELRASAQRDNISSRCILVSAGFEEVGLRFQGKNFVPMIHYRRRSPARVHIRS